MKKVLGTLAVAVVLVAAFPMTASAGNIKSGCGITLRPCPTSMPPSSNGNPNGTRSGGNSTGHGSGTGTSRGAGSGRPLPPSTMPPISR